MSSPKKIELNFELWPRQLEAFNSPATEWLYGGSAGGGKSHLERVISIVWCLEIPGLQYFLFRRQYSDLVKSYIEGPTGYEALLAPLIHAGQVESVAKEIRFPNGSKIYLCHCFTGDTLIQTTEGDRRIRDLIGKTGTIKVTKSFTTRFENARLTRKAASIVTVKFEDGTSCRCTGDHRFLTLDGYIEAKNLAGKSCLTNQSQLSVQRLNSLKEKGSAETQMGITEARGLGFIELFGNTIMGQSQKAMKFITLMKTRITTAFTILSLRKLVLIENYMPAQSVTSSRQDWPGLKVIKRQENGTLLLRGIGGIRNRLLRFNPLRLIKSAKNAEQHSKDFVTQDIEHAQKAAGLNYNEQKEKPHLIKCSSVELSGIEDVYCMTVPEIGLFPLSNGVLVSNCQYEKDVLRFGSFEFHVLNIAEAGEFTPFMLNYLRSRNRMPVEYIKKLPKKYLIPKEYWRDEKKPEYQFPRSVLSCNPIGPGKIHLQDNFVDNHPPGDIWRAEPEKGGMLRQFIRARLNDNPSLDPVAYANQLKGIGSKGYVEALLEGRWDTTIGAYFSDLKQDIHEIEPFEIPPYWPREMAMDFGGCGDGDPFAIGWFTISDGSIRNYPRGSAILYRLWYGEGLPQQTTHDIAQGIIEREKNETVTRRVGGRDMFKHYGGPSIRENMAEYGLYFRMADDSREPGWQQTRNWIKGRKDKPELYAFNNCPQWFKYMASLQYDRDNPNDCAQEGDHIPEMTRYYVMSRSNPKDQPTPPPWDLKDLTKNKVLPPKVTLDTLWSERDERR